MRGRVCIVTGASRGIGKATATELARRGATTVMLCRDADRGGRAVEDVQRAATSGDVSLAICDLASFGAIRSAAGEIAARWPRVHVLVNNAGISLGRRIESADGIEMTLAVNHLAPFLLTQSLLPALRAGAPSRVVNVSSELERWGRIDFGDLQGERRYNGTRAYLQSKLANVLFTYALAERLAGTGVTANCVYPGLAATDLLRDRWWWRAPWLRPLWRVLFLTPDEGAQAAVWAATAPEISDVSGACFARSRRRIRTSRRSRDAALAAQLWAWSTRLTQPLERRS
jgi:NAD(P)-dependent dehydrogenase (short-subunit alcohol dehydrogenase family)